MRLPGRINSVRCVTNSYYQMIEGECRHLPDREASFDRQAPRPYLVASRNVIKKMSDSDGRGWHLRAPEIESAVASVSITSRHASLPRC